MATCCFIGHRKIKEKGNLSAILKATIIELVAAKGVRTFLFGSRSEFDDLCHSIVTDIQAENPSIQRILYGVKSETAPNKDDKEVMERHLKRVYGKEIVVKDYEGFVQPDCVFSAGKASYERPPMNGRFQ